MEQNDDKKAEKPVDQKNDQQENEAVPAAQPKKPEETEFNVRKGLSVHVMVQWKQNLIPLLFLFVAEGDQQADFRFGKGQWFLQLQCK